MADVDSGDAVAQSAPRERVTVASPGVVFFARHGQCRSNVQWPIDNYKDSEDGLTELGLHEAAACGRFLKASFPNFSWRIISSALTRAIQTAELIQQVTEGVFVKKDPRLNEYGHPRERLDALHQRVVGFLEDLSLESTDANERFLVVTHGHVLEYLLYNALGTESGLAGNKNMHSGLLGHANGAVSAFHAGRMLLWNSHMHLV
jgi:broad specificity phosphatase PhoE